MSSGTIGGVSTADEQGQGTAAAGVDAQEAPTTDQQPARHPAVHPWQRYVALGDSFTEGIGDPDPDHPGYHRGWADRVAQELANSTSNFAYANLAVRGKLIEQIRDEQVAPALELKPDLITLCAGGNDVIRPGSDPDAIARILDTVVQILSVTGATIVLFNGPDIRDTPMMGSIRGKVAIFNENVRTVAKRHDAVVADMWSLRELVAIQMWDEDRLHFSPLGHHTIAGMVLETLNVPHTLDPVKPHPPAERSWREARVDDAVWARHHLFPWVIRRLRGRSSGDGITAKRPDIEPLFGGSMPPGSADGDGGGGHLMPGTRTDAERSSGPHQGAPIVP